MAQLPDLDPNTASTIAWWNVGVTITKSQILPILASFVEYDNGITGTLSVSGIIVNVRVRTDGLLVAYALRSNEPANGVVAAFDNVAVTGPLNRTFFASNYGVVGSTLLGIALDTMENAVTTLGKIPVVLASVNYYDFVYTAATTIYVLSISAGITNGSPPGVRGPGNFTVPIGVGVSIVGASFVLNGSGNNSYSLQERLNGVVLMSFGVNGDGHSRFMQENAAGLAPLLTASGTANAFDMNIPSISTGASTGGGISACLVLFVTES